MIHHTVTAPRGATETRSGPDGLEAGMVAADPRMLELRDLARRAADTTAPVLTTGESGVGKEVLARFIHGASPRASGPFVKINCAAIPHDLLESELFGHERGAFTGAHQRHEGHFTRAHGGTLLLDEIGEMSLPLQAKLLHVLEDLSFIPVGGTRPVSIDARVLATTNKDLEGAVDRGEFRADLYFRLKVIRLHIPPLRERQADIPPLCEHFVRRFAAAEGVAPRLPERLLAAFLRYRWPGNVRELKHLVQRFLILRDVETVLAEISPPAGAAGHRVAAADAVSRMAEALARSDEKIPLKALAARAAEQVERTVILEVLRENRWNRKQAAAQLDICYKTLLKKLQQWRLDGEDSTPAQHRDEGAADGGPDLVHEPPPPGSRPSPPPRRGRSWALRRARRPTSPPPPGPPRRLRSS